ncbi:hypothetical protein PDL02_26385 [Bacillus cereus group sp. LD113LC]|nr:MULTISPECIES: hypothetical protein [Bacillus cereus group]MCU5562403.1 hypothetical protein [Bacillus pacificus]MDA1625811.1 hypothetical protein [Bacillus cereus group sp. TH206-1LC]MDA1753030.1 hypothetical protein [Bacillus cereus group sp. LD113LC]MDX5917495.1 hypothetical protein [Bacillus cereus group sp. BfR-BA-01026]
MKKLTSFFKGERFKYTTCPHCGHLTDYYSDVCDYCDKPFK